MPDKLEIVKLTNNIYIKEKNKEGYYFNSDEENSNHKNYI